MLLDVWNSSDFVNKVVSLELDVLTWVGGGGGASCQSGGACFKPSPPLAASRACAVARRRARESGANNCPPARLPAGAARTLIFVVGIGKWSRRPCEPASLEIVQATYCDFIRGDWEMEMATLSTSIAGDCASEFL